MESSVSLGKVRDKFTRVIFDRSFILKNETLTIFLERLKCILSSIGACYKIGAVKVNENPVPGVVKSEKQYPGPNFCRSE